MVKDLGVKIYSVRGASGVWRQKLKRGSCQMQGMRKCKLLKFEKMQDCQLQINVE